MTNKGLRLETVLLRNTDSTLFMPLNCGWQAVTLETVGIYLVEIGGGIFARELPSNLAAAQVAEKSLKPKLIYIIKDVKDARYL